MQGGGRRRSSVRQTGRQAGRSTGRHAHGETITAGGGERGERKRDKKRR